MTDSTTQLPPILEAEGVEYAYATVPAVRELSMQVNRGERVALVGANGSGKSTLLRMLDGLLLPQSGRLRFDGVCFPMNEYQNPAEEEDGIYCTFADHRYSSRPAWLHGIPHRFFRIWLPDDIRCSSVCR